MNSETYEVSAIRSFINVAKAIRGMELTRNEPEAVRSIGFMFSRCL